MARERECRAISIRPQEAVQLGALTIDAVSYGVINGTDHAMSNSLHLYYCLLATPWQTEVETDKTEPAHNVVLSEFEYHQTAVTKNDVVVFAFVLAFCRSCYQVQEPLTRSALDLPLQHPQHLVDAFRPAHEYPLSGAVLPYSRYRYRSANAR
mmetsp:Transcript_17216/g.49897  ORF Transcript_17216/g.49897 Transcript_17216/m.49897 type:complete len:153 (+) Transcript_17216:4010-4468(+)